MDSIPDTNARLTSTFGHISFVEINALTPARMAEFDVALIAFVRLWSGPSSAIPSGYTHVGFQAALNSLLNSFGVLFSLTESGPYVDRARNENVCLGVRVGSFMAQHSTQFVTDGHYRSFVCWQIVSDLLVFRGLQGVV